MVVLVRSFGGGRSARSPSLPAAAAAPADSQHFVTRTRPCYPRANVRCVALRCVNVSRRIALVGAPRAVFRARWTD